MGVNVLFDIQIELFDWSNCLSECRHVIVYLEYSRICFESSVEYL